jgi:hypothetical protein
VALYLKASSVDVLPNVLLVTKITPKLPFVKRLNVDLFERDC